ncbi:hypothetical protein [Streptomyces sp. NPDC049813]|uniref:hypothetical protein n=1 Tax=Streptomyces sp. NPDC049813 TaxID=3365597 RepID=UPI003798BA5D
MRSIAKYAVVGALVTPMVMAGAGLAAAEPGPGYGKSDNSATVYGGSTSKTLSGFKDGKAYFVKASKTATATGATGNATGSHS